VELKEFLIQYAPDIRKCLSAYLILDNPDLARERLDSIIGFIKAQVNDEFFINGLSDESVRGIKPCIDFLAVNYKNQTVNFTKIKLRDDYPTVPKVFAEVKTLEGLKEVLLDKDPDSLSDEEVHFVVDVVFDKTAKDGYPKLSDFARRMQTNYRLYTRNKQGKLPATLYKSITDLLGNLIEVYVEVKRGLSDEDNGATIGTGFLFE